MRIVATASLLFLLFISPFQPSSLSQSISLRKLRVSVAERFDSMQLHGKRTPGGWYVGTISVAADTGLRLEGPGGSAGGHYNWGSEDSTDRALGSRASNNHAQYVEARYQNLTDTALTAIFFRYDGVQWLDRENTANESGLRLVISENGGLFTDADPKFWFRPAPSADRTEDEEQVRTLFRSGPIGGLHKFRRPIQPGGHFALRWIDQDDEGQDGAIGVDNVLVTPLSTVPVLAGKGSFRVMNPDLDNSDVFERDIPQTVHVQISGSHEGFLERIRIEMPPSWSDVDPEMVRLIGTKGSESILDVREREIQIASASITYENPCIVEIVGVEIATGDSHSMAHPAVQISTAGRGEDFASIADPPGFFSLLPVSSIRQYDPSVSSSFGGGTVAVAGTILNSTSLTSGVSEYYVQDGESGIRVYSDDVTLRFREGERYVLKGDLVVTQGQKTINLTFAKRIGYESLVEKEYGSVTDLLADAESIEGTLVLLKNLRWSGLPGVNWQREDADATGLYVADNAGTDSVKIVLCESSGIVDTALPQPPFVLRGIFDRRDSPSASDKECVIILRSSDDVDPIAVPPPPRLLGPGHDAKDQPLNVTFSWTGSSHTERYHAQLAFDSSFAKVVQEDSMVADTSWQVRGLLSGTSYYWRVRGLNEGGTGEFSFYAVFATLPHPSVRIVSPVIGDTLFSSSASLTLRASNFEFDSLTSVQGDPRSHHGHIRVRVDGKFARMDVRPETHVTRLTPGRHMIAAELVSSDGSSLRPPVSDSIEVFVAQKISRLSISPSSEGMYFVEHNSSSLPLTIVATGASGSEPLARSPQYSISVDGKSIGIFAGQQAAVTRMEPGIHRVRADIVVSGEGRRLMPVFDETWVKVSESAPYISITNPVGGDTLYTKVVSVIVRKRNFQFGSDSTQSGDASNRGYLVLSVDGLPVDSAGKDLTTLQLDVSPGLHTIRAELHSTSGAPLTPPVFDVMEIFLQSRSASDVPEDLPAKFNLMQNYPNPFNAETEIRFEISEEAPVSLRVFNLLGQEVITLLDQRLEPGLHSARWNGLNSEGKRASSGIYVYRLQAGTFVATRRMMLLK